MSEQRSNKYGYRTSSLHDWTYYKLPYGLKDFDYLRKHVSAPSFMRLCRALDRGKANGVYVTQPGSTLRAPWRKHKHPLDVLQSSLDLAAAKDPYTQARFQNIPSSGQANRSIVGDISDRENNRGSDNTSMEADAAIYTIPGVEDVFLSRHFCRQYSGICNEMLLHTVLLPLKLLLSKRETEYCRKACRRWWIFILYKRRQQWEQNRLSKIMRHLGKQANQKFLQRVRLMLVEWKVTAHKERMHFVWQYKMFRLTYLWKRWVNFINRQRWHNSNAVRLLLRMQKIESKWRLNQTVRRFITWKENTERLGIVAYVEWKLKTLRVFLYRWRRCIKIVLEERAAIGYEMSRQLRINTMDTTSTKNKPLAPKSMEQVLMPTGMLFASHTSTTFENSDGLNALSRKICLRVSKESFGRWKDYCQIRIKRKKEEMELKQKRRYARKIHSQPHSCHLSNCIAPCPPTCTYYLENRRRRLYGWAKIEI